MSKNSSYTHSKHENFDEKIHFTKKKLVFKVLNNIANSYLYIEIQCNEYKSGILSFKKDFDIFSASDSSM